MRSTSTDVTQLLLDWKAGEAGALDRLMPVVSEELHRQARGHLFRERASHTLQPTALVNEAYLRLIDQKRVQWQNRAHFFAIASRTMRRILVDHARRHQSAKRGGNVVRVPLQEVVESGRETDVDLIALDRALEKLSGFASRQSRIVEMRFFGGLTIQETAEVLGVSRETVKVDWSMAKAWLLKELQRT